jgi:tetratricopeptide (TPR) repeat protein
VSDDYSSIPVPLFNHTDLRHALEKLRQAEPLGDSPLRRLVWVRHRVGASGPPPTPEAFEMALGEAVTHLIEENLGYLRQIEESRCSPLETRQAEMEALRSDFASGNIKLEAWSALYYRYVRVDLNLRVQDIAYTLNADSRQVRRRLDHGCRRLTGQISLLERDARIEHRQLWMHIKLPPGACDVLFGRTGELADLVNALADPAAPAAVGLMGPGGIGKTALAHAAAEAIIARDILQDIAWLTLSGPTSYRALLDALALALGYPHLTEYELADAEGALYARLIQTPALIVLDGIENCSDYPVRLGRLVSLAGAGRLLFTTQHRPPDEMSVRLFVISPLEREDIASLIRHHIRQRRISREAARLSNEAIESIYAAIGGNPLAAQLVAGQIGSLPLARILDNLEGLRTAEGVSLFEHLFAPTWEELDADARQVALAFGLLPREGGSWHDIERLVGLSSEALDRALATLVAASLLETAGREPRYRMHALISRFVETRAASPPDDALYRALLDGAAAPQPPTETPEAQVEVAHALTAIRAHAEGVGSLRALVDLIVQAAPFVRRLGYWSAWEALLAQAIRRLRDSDEPGGLAAVLLEMGIVQHWLGNAEAAMGSLQEAIEIYGSNGDFVRQAEALSEIGRLHHEMGQMASAYEAYQRAAASAKRYDSPPHFRKAAIGLASLALHNNRPDQALDLLHQALDMLEEGEPPDCQLLTSLCAAYLQAGNPEQALHYQTQALEAYRAAGDLPNQARALLRLGTVHVELDQFDDALACLQNGLALMRSLGDALGQARALTNLGTVHYHREQPEMALSTWQEALGLQQQLHDQIGLAYTLYNLADLQWSLGNRREARSLMEQSRAVVERLGLAALGERISAHPMFADPNTSK